RVRALRLRRSTGAPQPPRPPSSLHDALPIDQRPEQRKVAGEMKQFGIFQSADKPPADMIQQADNDREYEVSYRSGGGVAIAALADRKSTRLNSSHGSISYAVFCLKKKNNSIT